MVKKRIVEIAILETVEDKQFEDILSMFSIIEGVCGAHRIPSRVQSVV